MMLEKDSHERKHMVIKFTLGKHAYFSDCELRDEYCHPFLVNRHTCISINLNVSFPIVN